MLIRGRPKDHSKWGFGMYLRFNLADNFLNIQLSRKVPAKHNIAVGIMLFSHGNFISYTHYSRKHKKPQKLKHLLQFYVFHRSVIIYIYHAPKDHQPDKKIKNKKWTT